MEHNLALEVRFQGETQIYSPSYRTSWQDLFAMLKCSFEMEDMVVFYVDDEEDEIAIDTQEEYCEAKKNSASCHHVLRLRVYPKEELMDVDNPPTEGEDQSQKPEETNKRKRVHTPAQPDLGTSSNAPPPSGPIPIPSSRPTVPPRLNRARSLPSHKQDTVTGCVKKAVAELKQLNASQPELNDDPDKEKELIDQIVKGVLNGLDTSVRERSRPHSWDPSQGQEGARVPLCSSPLPAECGTRPKTTSPSQGLILEHKGVSCASCLSTISGIRFKCGHCTDYDLCENCEALPGVHDPNHVFLKLKRPAFRAGMRSDGRLAPILKHPLYADDDTPVWEYKINKLKEKIARKAARTELKRKYREEKRRAKIECHGPISPTNRKKIEKMAERQAEQIMAAASFAVAPTTTTTSGAKATAAETTPLLVRKFDAGFVRDGNLPDDTHMQPNTKFVKSWILKNNGNAQWNYDTKLKYLWGDIQLLSPDPMEIPPLAAGDEGPICVDFEAPAKPGHYHSHWRLTQKGEQFGHRVWCNIIVDKAEVLEPTCEKRSTIQEEIVLPKESEPVQTDSTENTASSAVAHLQSDHLDNSAPSRIVSSSDLLTAQDVLSFELLSIRDDQDADKEVEGVNSPAATTTPNNTPIVGLTPCISPVPQLDEKLLCRRVSEHSDLEIIRREDIPEIIETSDLMIRNGPISEMPQEGVEIGASFSDNEDDVESMCSSSDSDILDDYCVVPLPDCFDPSKPIDKSMIMSRTSLASSMTSSSVLQSSSENSSLVRLPSYEESQAEIESSTNPHDNSAPAEDSAPIPQADEIPIGTLHVADETEEDAATDPEESNEGTTEPIMQGEAEEATQLPRDAATSNVSPSVDSLLGTTNPSLQTAPLIPLVASTPTQQLSSTPSSPISTSPTAQTVAVAPMPVITLLASPVAIPTTPEGGVLINPEGTVIYEAPNQPEIVRQTETTPAGANDGTNIDLIGTTSQPQETSHEIEVPTHEAERPEEHDDEFHDAQDMPNDRQNQYNGVQFETQSDPVDLLGYAAGRAVEVAGSVVRQAFDTAANSVSALLRPQPIPMPAPYQPPAHPRYQPPSPSSMDQLIEMGFGDRAKNRQLLEKHNKDVSRCVQDLLQEEDNDWHNNRH